MLFRWLACCPFLALATAGGFSSAFAQEPQPREVEVRYNLVYASHAGKNLALDVYLPSGEGPFPAAMVVHGGAWRLGNKGQLASYARALAENGIASFAINYRLAPEHPFPAQIEDCRDALRWIGDNAATYRIDTAHIGGVGYSAGGHLVALLGAQGIPDEESPDEEPANRKPPRLCVVAAGGAPCDFRVFPERWDGLAYWLGGTRRQLPDVYREASPAAFATADDPPMFFYHGESDALVPRQSPQIMVDALKAAGVEAEIYLAPGIGHIATTADAESLRRGFEFLQKHLLPPQGEPDGD